MLPVSSGLRPRAFIRFLVFGNPDETIALVFEILHLPFGQRQNHFQGCYIRQFTDGWHEIGNSVMRVSQGFWGTRKHWQNIEGNKGKLANFWEQGNKIRKITVRKHSDRVWEHGNIGQFWKGTRTPPWETLSHFVPCKTSFKVYLKKE